MSDLLEGFDSEGYEDFCEEVYNNIKNHFRQSDPCGNLSGIQPGMIVSDSDDDKLYHYTGASGAPCEEILQETYSCDLVPDFKGVDFYTTCGGDYATIEAIAEAGLGHRLTIGLDETTRTMVICDLGDINVDFGLAVAVNPSLIIFNAAGTASALFSAVQVILPTGGAAAAPLLAFGDGDTGFYEGAANNLYYSAGGAPIFQMNSGGFEDATLGAGPSIRHEAATATNPIYVTGGDYDTGLGFAAADQLSLIAGGVEGIRVIEAAAAIEVRSEGPIKILEVAAALADTANYGQLWVKNTTPCELWFTDDAGTDTQIV